jgi:hypothetical protein
MLCYRDMTFCPYYMDCEEGNDCPRALKPHIIGKAAEAGLEISAYLDRPECFAAIRKPTSGQPKGDGNGWRKEGPGKNEIQSHAVGDHSDNR